MGIIPPGGPSAELLTEANLPVAIPNDIDRIVKIISDLLESHSHRKGITISEQFEEVIRNYDIRSLTKKLEEIFVNAERAALAK